MRRVKVFWWKGQKKTEVATLLEHESGAIALEWNQAFLGTEIELSPLRLKKEPGIIVMPKEPFEGLYGLFNDYVPDGFGRRLLRRAFEKQGLRRTEIHPLDMLQYIGERGMGALSFEPSLAPDEKWAGTEVNLDDLNKAVEPILSGTPSAVLDQFIAGGSSPNGMRPKFLATLKDEKFYVGGEEPNGGEHWLVKFRAPIDPPDIALIEYTYYKMAKAAGLNVSESKVFESKTGKYFGTKRFDRNRDGRIHMHTLSGMLHAAPSNYSVSYENFAALAKRITKNASSLEEVFKIAAFNIYSCNQDDHTKNVAFLMDKEGRWSVAPAYDLTFNLTREAEHKMLLNGTGTPKERDILAFGRAIGIRAPRVRELNEGVKHGVSKFRTISKRVGVSKERVNAIGRVLEARFKKEHSNGKGHEQ